jgi:putative peptide zinc metalloprotease protein
VVERRVTHRGHALWVWRNPASGRYFRSAPRLRALARMCDGHRTVAEAMTMLRPAPDAAEERQLLQGLTGMMAAGLVRVPGTRPAAPPAPSPGLAAMRMVAFIRLPLADLTRLLPWAEPVLGPLYTRGGAVVLALLLLAAGIALAGESEALAAQFVRLGDLGAADVLTGYAIFALTKLLHETGHAVAARRMARAEGQPDGPYRIGVSFLFGLPAPYVDVSSAWLIASPTRRAAVGLGGVATDLTLAALAALAWSAIGAGTLADRLFDVMLVCGASSLLFNLNPLVRLDGYFVLSDLVEIPDLQPRGQAALGRVLARPLGLPAGPAQPGEAVFAAYGLASLIYRWGLYAAIFWMAAGQHWALGMAVLIVVATLFFAVPAWRWLRGWVGFARSSPGRAMRGPALLAGLLAAALMVPLPEHVVAHGVAWHEGTRLVFAPADGEVRLVAPPGATEGAVLVLENPETRRLLAQLHAEVQSLEIEARRSRADAAGRIDAAEARRQSVLAQIATLEAEIASWTVQAAPGARWEPLRAERLGGTWVRRDDARPLGALVGQGTMTIRAVLDQRDGPLALAALAGADASLPVRRFGEGPALFQARPAGPAGDARDELPSPALASAFGGPIAARAAEGGALRPTERVFELRLAPEAGAPALPHGQRMEVRIALPPAALAMQLWRRGRQILQRRLEI